MFIILQNQFITMGIIERKAREKEDLKSLILEAAMKLFVEKGIAQTTIRNIAHEIEYSVGTVYVYYKDKNDIFYDLHAQGFKQLGDKMKVLFNVTDPMERLKALGRSYIQFAVENPDMYDLMFTMKAPMEFLESTHKEDWNEGKATFKILSTTVSQCVETGHFTGHKLEPLVFVIWSVVHGIASLYTSQRIGGVILEDSKKITMNGYEEFVKILEKI
jgi:AcrR family transcriptional regulator